MTAKEQIKQYWLKQINKPRSCPKCKIGTLIACNLVFCNNCGKEPCNIKIIKLP